VRCGGEERGERMRRDRAAPPLWTGALWAAAVLTLTPCPIATDHEANEETEPG